MQDKQLSKHFTLYELVKPSHRHLLTNEILLNLTKLCHEVEWAREKIGKPFIVTSGWRPEEYNKAIGGAPGSYHIKGLAMDFVVEGLPACEVRKRINDWPYGMEETISWVHLDIRPYKARFGPK